ncbi:MAG: hypothetical protein QOJ76_3445 [Acidobacteriota bacterium]|nr:hypothetical protein [Acidobacteriota bacterium]
MLIDNPHSEIIWGSRRAARSVTLSSPIPLKAAIFPNRIGGPKASMSDPSKTDTIPPSQRPRSPRVPVNFTVELEVENDAGDIQPFRVTAEAVRVSRGGATLITDIPARAGMRVRLTPPFGRALDAEVNGVWTDDSDGQQHIGVKLLDPNGWFAE